MGSLLRLALIRFGPRLARSAWSAFKNRRAASGARGAARRPAAPDRGQQPVRREPVDR